MDVPSRLSSSRRAVLAAAGGAIAFASAGCLDLDALSSDDGTIEPEPPGEDPQGTPGEFYYLLEENGVEVDRLVREEEGEEGDEDAEIETGGTVRLLLFYHSEAETQPESNEEIGMIYRIFKEGLVQRGTDVEQLVAEIVDPFEGQPVAWGVRSDWARAHGDGELGDDEIWQRIVNTKVFEEDLDGDDEDNDVDDEDDEPGDDGTGPGY